MLRSCRMFQTKELATPRLFTALCILVALVKYVIWNLLGSKVRLNLQSLIARGFIPWIVYKAAGEKWTPVFQQIDPFG